MVVFQNWSGLRLKFALKGKTMKNEQKAVICRCGLKMRYDPQDVKKAPGKGFGRSRTPDTYYVLCACDARIAMPAPAKPWYAET